MKRGWQRHTRIRNSSARQVTRWLACWLVALLPCLGLGIAQRQTLGPLHVHALPAVASGQGGAPLLHEALSWWWAQVQAQTHARQHAYGHAREHAHEHATEHARRHARHDHASEEHASEKHAHWQQHPHAEASAALPAQAESAAHAHAVLQRHHHGMQDASVMALDATAEAWGAQGAVASLLLPVLGAPARDLHIAADVARDQPWPSAGAARFSSRGTVPALQPPRG